MKSFKYSLALLSVCTLLFSTVSSVFTTKAVSANATEGWFWPAETYYIVSNYGLRDLDNNKNTGVNGLENKHTGIDISAPSGSPVHATKSGTIVEGVRDIPNGTKYKDKTKKEFGNYTTIKHDDGSGYSTYMHMLPNNLISGHVEQGDIIGYCGLTGNTGGYHIHFEVVNDPNDRYNTSVNTMPTNSNIQVKHTGAEYAVPKNWPTNKMTYVFTREKTTYVTPEILVSGFNAPQTIIPGNCFGLRGTATSSVGTITSVDAKILNSSIAATVYPNASSFSVSNNYAGGNINNLMRFDWLPSGSYCLYYKITAKNGDKTAVKELWYNFTVAYKCPTISVSTPLTAPSTLRKGSCFGIRGVLTTDVGVITYCHAYVVGTAQDYTCYPNSKTTDLRYNGCNDKLLFNKLKKGTYTYRVEVMAQNGNEVGIYTFERMFTVK